MQVQEAAEDLCAMPLFDHLTELRARVIKAVIGFAAAYAICLTFTAPLWKEVCRPAAGALAALGYAPMLYVSDPMEPFNIVYIKLPIVSAIFLAAPWMLYQLWAFVAPGLYRSELRWTASLLIAAALLFVGGGVFAYLALFRNSLEFLLDIGRSVGSGATVSMERYFGLFVNVVLGAGVTFE